MINRNTKEIVLLCAVLVLSALLAQKPLSDPDLGWHLASGLWMLQQGTVPTSDPFGAQGSPWLAYSWLPELLFAVLYRWGGFSLLWFLQFVLVVFSALCVTALYIVGENNLIGHSGRRSVLRLSLLILVLPLTAAIWSLRPQLFSLIFFCIFLCLLEQGKLRVLSLFIVSVLWVNTHLFWIFMPLVLWSYALLGLGWPVKARKLFFAYGALSLLSSLLNPYGLRMYSVFFSYLFEHQTAYQLITEFSPLSPKLEFSFVWALLLALSVALSLPSLVRARRFELIALSALLFSASCLHIKALPFFAVLSLICVRLPEWRKVKSKDAECAKPGQENPGGLIAAQLLIFSIGALFFLVEKGSTLSPKSKELLEQAYFLAQRAENKGEQELRVLNHFNDGGWLELGFFLGRKDSVGEIRCKSSIDGRTLVIGDQRLQEFGRLFRLDADYQEILQHWGVRQAILSRKEKLTQALLSQSVEKSLQGAWRVLRQGDKFVVLEKSAP